MGNTCLAENRFRARMKVGVDISRTRSRWIARVMQQVNRQIHTLSISLPFSLPIYTGPAKSTAVYVNGGASVTRKEGRGGVGGELKCFPSKHLHTTHLWITALRRLHPWTIQYFPRILPSVSFTPLCCTLWWALCTISAVRACSLCRSTWCLEEKEILAFCSLPLHLHMWLSSLKRPNCILQEGNLRSSSKVD